MSRANEDVSATAGGGMKSSFKEWLGKSPAGDLEPKTPQGPAAKPSDFPVEMTASKSATAGVPGAVPTTSQGRSERGGQKLEEDPSYHQPYPRDIHHGEHMFPGVKGHEAEEYERAEGYASPDDVSPEIKERVEKHAWESGQHQEHQPSTPSSSQATAAEAQTKQGLRASASNLVNKASTQATAARQYAGGAAERTKEAARQAAGVAKIQLHRFVVAGKEKVGIPAERPLLDVAKEKMGLSPDAPASEAMRQVLYSFTAWVFHFLVTFPATIQELHSRGKRLAEERDRAMAGNTLPPPPKPQQQGEGEEGKHDQSYQQQHGGALPIPREHVVQSAAGTSEESGMHTTDAGHGGFRDVSEAAPGAQGTSSLQGRLKGDVSVDESGMHSLK